MKSDSCLSDSVVKDTEVTDIGHRKEDSDRVPVHEESLYSRLQKQIHSSNIEVERDFCTEEPCRTVTMELSTESSTFQRECPLRLMEVEDTSESNSDTVEEQGISGLIVEVGDPKTVDNLNSSSYKKGHYSTNACDSIRLSSTSQVHVQGLHTVESTHENTCRSKGYGVLSPVCNNEGEIDSHSKQLSSTDERETRKIPNEDLDCKYQDNNRSPIDKKPLRRMDCRESDASIGATLHTNRSDDDYCDINSAKVIVVQKYAVDRDTESETCENLNIIGEETNRSDSAEFRGLNTEGIIGVKLSTNNILKCSNTVSGQEEEEDEDVEEEEEEEEESVVTKDSDVYVDSIDMTNIADKSEATALRAMDVNSRINITEEIGTTTDFNDVQNANYSDLTAGHRNLKDDGEHASKRSTSKRKDAPDATSRSRKSQKRLSSTKSKSKHGISAEEGSRDVSNGVADTKSHGKTGKSKNKSSRSQRRDRQRSATAEIGEADDDSGIQGDIYEFSEKESNLEDIGILSIIRRGGKHESRHVSSITSHLQEIQCNDDYSKAEPPVLVPEEPWPPATDSSQNEPGTDSNSGVQSGGNCDIEERLER